MSKKILFAGVISGWRKWFELQTSIIVRRFQKKHEEEGFSRDTWNIYIYNKRGTQEIWLITINEM